jgi:lipoprotein-releasing system permease protein
VLLATLAGERGSALGFAPRLKAFRLVGVFSSGLYTYDSSFGFTSIAAAQEFFDLGVNVTGIEVRLADMFDAPRVAAELMRFLLEERASRGPSALRPLLST